MPDYGSLKERKDYIDALFAEHADAIDLCQQRAATILTELEELGQDASLQQDPAESTSPMHSSSSAHMRISAFLNDRVTIFRFLRKAHFDEAKCLELLKRTLRWRLASALDAISPFSLDPLYADCPNGFFYLHPKMRDKFGRLAAVLNLANLKRPEDGSLESLKEFVAFQLEVVRRYLAHQSASTSGSHGSRDNARPPHIQIVLLLNLSSSSLSNFDLEMMPYTIDLLKNHFPGMVGAIFVLGYGWAYAGMWQVAKRVMPKVALDRILFPSTAEELLRYFDREHLLAEHGGTLEFTYRLSSNHILTKYGRPSHYFRPFRYLDTANFVSSPIASGAPSPSGSRPLSRVASFETLRTASQHSMSATTLVNGNHIWYSAPGTPRDQNGSSHEDFFDSKAVLSRTPSGARLSRTHSRRPSWLDMTHIAQRAKAGEALPMSNDHTPGTTTPQHQEPISPTVLLPRVGSLPPRGFRDALHAPEVTSLDRDYFYYEVDDDEPQLAGHAAAEYASETHLNVVDGEVDEWERESLDSSASSDGNFGNGSRSLSPRQSRALAVSQLRSQLSTLSQGPPQSSREPILRSGRVSPFSAQNPYYGYPSYLSSSHGGRITSYHRRRRKRDLAKTLGYLLVLRILNLHRKLTWRARIGLLWLSRLLVQAGAVSRRWAMGQITGTTNAEEGRTRAVAEGSRDDLHDSSSEDGVGPSTVDNGHAPRNGYNRLYRRPSRRRKAVHFTSESTYAPAPSIPLHRDPTLQSLVRLPILLFRLVPRWILYLSAVMFFRSIWFRRRMRRLLIVGKAEILARLPEGIRHRVLELARRRE